VDFKLENVLVSLHSLKTMGLGPFGASAPLFLRNGELLGHSPIHNLTVYYYGVFRARNPKLCELCKTDINIQWKCVECNKFICNRCKDIHLNVQTNIQHQIIDIKSLFQDVQPKIITNNIPCTEHTTKMTFLFFICIIHPWRPCGSSKYKYTNKQNIENYNFIIISNQINKISFI
jgi:membrane protein CcdC involved in cytochrome C biogenesis